MQYRPLGTNGPQVSAIGFGATVLSPGVYGEVHDERSLAALESGLEHGLNLIDTARLYGDGQKKPCWAAFCRAAANRWCSPPRAA